MRYGRLDLLVPVLALAVCVEALAQMPTYNLGRTPSAEEIQAMSFSFGPGGKGLPPGSGTAKEGAEIYARQCAVCHGPNLEGSPGGPRLAGGKKHNQHPEPCQDPREFLAVCNADMGLYQPRHAHRSGGNT